MIVRGAPSECKETTADHLAAEKALTLLPSPLTATDEYYEHSRRDSCIVTAGLHRQVWVSGQSLLTDVHIVNNLKKGIRRLELQLERVILHYRHVGYP